MSLFGYPSFWIVLKKNHFGRRTGHYCIILASFEIFMILLIPEVLSRLATCEATRIFFNNNNALFHLW